MYDNSSVFEHIKLPTRAIEAVLGEEERHRFLIGSYSINPDNELHLIEFIEETNEVVTQNIFDHPNEIKNINTCPNKHCSTLFFTTHRGGYMKQHFKSVLLKKKLEYEKLHKHTYSSEKEKSTSVDTEKNEKKTNDTNNENTNEISTDNNEKKNSTDTDIKKEENEETKKNENTEETESKNISTDDINTDKKEETPQNNETIENDEKKESKEISPDLLGSEVYKNLLDERLLDDSDLFRATLWRIVDLDSINVSSETLISFETPETSLDPSDDNFESSEEDFNISSLNNITSNINLNPLPKNVCIEPLYTLPNISKFITIENENKVIKLSHDVVLWDPTCSKEQFITLSYIGCIQLWKISKYFKDIKEYKCIYDPIKLNKLTCGCWDPHYPNRFISCNDKSIKVWNPLNNFKLVDTINNAHKYKILSVDHNPNKPYHIITCGMDRTVKFWDLRYNLNSKSNMALKVISNHSHWIYSCKYNRFHDELVITSGSDNNINLWDIVSVSSAPLGELEENINSKDDTLIRTYRDHEESIYQISWSNNNAWVFASLSTDGRVVINHVPAATKYKILL